MKPYPDVNPQAKFPEVEEKILSKWKDENTFEKSIEIRPKGVDGANEYVFYDGPPFANGLPHYGHLLTGYVKDIVPRYQTMRGKRVDRRFGWDCHGLPAEMEAEKDLEISGRQQIEDYGIDKFNDYCQSSVLKYTKEWESYVTRQARWVDFENDYKTLDLPYMESVMWAFKELFNKGLIYEGYKVVPYSWAAETPLSNFETRMDDSYRPRQDPAVTVQFELSPKESDPGPLHLMVWTTTPWTLPSNLAVAVGKDIEYAVMKEGERYYLVAEAVLGKYEEQLKDAERHGTMKGIELVGRKYTPLFPYFKDHENAFRILAGDFVNTEEGTGAVHLAPGFGEDDQKLCEANDIAVVCPVDEQGKFTDPVTEYVGLQVFEANKPIIKHLKGEGKLVKHETYEHNYPHCWRTDTPIIYRALSSWYVRVTDFKDRMIELNKEINWIPEHIRDGQFGKWLENARDWAISRSRYWGAPIPVWKSDNPEYPRVDIYGSIDEIERDFGVRPDNLHRPFIDELTRPNPDDPEGKSMMRRVPDVLDCWFESGSMPFAQIHYPFENKEWFEHHFPADFIVEYVAQTRGWFYTLMVLSTALFDRPPFKNCICHGVVVDTNGRKLSKRLRNYPSPEEVSNTIGADALRWFLCSSSVLRGGDLQIDKEGKMIAEIVRTVINPIWNAYYFFTLYANTDEIKAEYKTDSDDLLDKYILSKTSLMLKKVTEHMDGYEIPEACAELSSFIDVLNNWYIRRSRDRFWKHDKDQDKTLAYNTLYTVLYTLTKALAPLLPLISEEIYTGLTGEESVHLTDWPANNDFPIDEALAFEMDQVREICSATLSLRESHRLRTRLPLQCLTIAGSGATALRGYEEIIKDEVNVKEVRFSETSEEFATFVLQLNSRSLGPKLGKRMKEVLTEAKAGNWEKSTGEQVKVAGMLIEKEDYELTLKPIEGTACQAIGSLAVLLDTNITPDLEQEGLARDIIRSVQQARKDAGFHVADHITLTLTGANELETAVKAHESFVAEQTLADRVEYSSPDGSEFTIENSFGENKLQIGVSRVS